MNTLSELPNAARELAERFGENPEKAYFTGLIHDCAKCLPKMKHYILSKPF